MDIPFSGGVLVAHPGTQHSYELAFALHRARLLERYVTGFYYKEDTAWGRTIRISSRAIPPATRRRLLGRSKMGLPSDRVIVRPSVELLYAGSCRLPWLRRYASRVLEWRNDHFDEFAGRIVEQIEPAAVVCYNSCALKTFQQAQSFGALRILDQSIGHLSSGLDLLKEEAERSPEFAEDERIDAPQRLIERCEQETSLADIILAGSEYVKTTLVAHGVLPSRIRVVPYGVDVARFVAPPAQKRTRRGLRLLFVGQIGIRKGIRYLLEAVRRLKSRGVELTLVGAPAGSGRGLDLYRDYFRHIPHVPHGEIHRLFHDADVFVFPSLHEGSALATYEALACGLPVITTPNSGSVVRDGVDGFIVPVRDADALEEKISLLLGSDVLREHMSENARRRAEEFSWSAYHTRIAQLFHEELGFASASCVAAAS
jgi:glycosyltransferase involved in cell wall biosynthesis